MTEDEMENKASYAFLVQPKDITQNSKKQIILNIFSILTRHFGMIIFFIEASGGKGYGCFNLLGYRR